MLYPWQKSQWHYFLEADKADRLPHAVLLTGLEGLGQDSFAQSLSQSLLCFSPDFQACGHCQACQLFTAGAHPDYAFVEPEKASKVIKVEQIREVTQKLAKTAQLNRYQVLLINPAELMNKAAANALLKTLEEPQGQVFIILVSCKPHQLPKTISSRCQAICFKAPSAAQAHAWLTQQLQDRQAAFDPKRLKRLLELSQNAPLKTLALIEDSNLAELYSRLDTELFARNSGERNVIKLAQFCGQFAITEVLDYLQRAVIDLVGLSYHREAQVLVAQHDCLNPLDAPGYFAYYDQLLEARKLCETSTAINQQLLLENLLMSWYKLAAI